MRIDKITRVGYATIVEANGGEEQFTMLTSFGQNGRCKIVVVTTQVDYGMNILYDGNVQSTDVKNVISYLFSKWHKPNAFGDDSAPCWEDLDRFLKTACGKDF